MSFDPPARLGRYDVVSKIGSGGMGVVYKAHDPRLGRHVAVKLLAPDRTRDDLEKERFVDEARAASSLDHVNICTIHEISETEDGQLYLVMAYYDGETVGQRLRRGAIDLQAAIDITVQAAAGLAEAHAAGIVHRDIKPENLLITRSGVVKILDFGLAKLTGMEVATHRTGEVSGTVAYMSPEQVSGQSLDQRTDIWSLAVVLYELLVGRRPFHGDNLLALSRAIAYDQPSASVAGRLNAPPEIEPVIARALAKSPADRYQRVADFAADLRTVATDAGLDVRFSSTGTADSSSASSVARGNRRAPSIAVLPFSDMSPQKDHEYFCEGIAEELINALARIEGLHVAARTSSFQLKGHGDVGEIARRLRVKTVLDGSVRKAGNRLRITAQLVNASNGFHLWSERYDRDMDDVFAVQDEIARSVAEKLRVTLMGDPAAPLVKQGTTDLEAYHAFLRGRHSRFTLYDLRGAIAFFEKAAQQDPGYALAHAAIADCYTILGLYAVLAPAVAAAQATAAVQRALAIEPDLPEAHSTLAQIRFLFDLDWLEADLAFGRALELNPSGVETFCWYGYFLASMGQPDRGLALVQRAIVKDPLSAYVAGYAGVILYSARRFDEAIERCREALQIQPGHGFALNMLAHSYSVMGRHDEAVAHAEQLVTVSKRTSHSLGILGSVAAPAGQRDVADAIIAELSERERTGYVSPVTFAGLYAAVGNFDRAFADLERACQERTPTLHSIWFPHYDVLRADARWGDVVRRLQLPPFSPLFSEAT
jgi:serine/threonine protein kinase/tetratricopeptide (TPR) repeat protein